MLIYLVMTSREEIPSNATFWLVETWMQPSDVTNCKPIRFICVFGWTLSRKSGEPAGRRPRPGHGRKLSRMFITEQIVRTKKGLYEKYFQQKWVWFRKQTVQNLISKKFWAVFFPISFILRIKTSPSAWFLLLSTTFRLLRELFRR